VSPSWESRLEAARKARTDGAGESGPAASRDLPLPQNVTWHRVSLVTPVLEGWKIVTGVLAFVTVQNLDDLVRAYRFISEHDFSLGGQIGYYLLGLAALIALWVVLGLLSWWRRAYAVDADGVYLRSGILSRKLRTARLPRIQSVDVVHPLLGRIFGLGQLTVEVAGGRNSRVVIGFLTTRELQTLRDRILDLAAGQIDLPGPAVAGGAVGASAVGRDTGGIDDAASAVRPEDLAPEGAAGSQTAPEQRAVPMQASHFQEYPLYSVDGATLLGSLLRSVSLYLSLILPTVVIVVGIIASVVDAPPSGGVLALATTFISTVAGAVSLVWSRFNNAWNFQAAATPTPTELAEAAGVGYAVVDLETTGLSPTTDSILEVALVLTDAAGRVERSWSTLIDPGAGVDVGPTHIHGLVADEIIGAPGFDEVADLLVADLAGRAVVAHNARFDVGFLTQALGTRGLLDRGARVPRVCTMEWARHFMTTPSRRLTTCCEVAGVEIGRHHNALDDELAAAGPLLAAELDADED